MSLSYGVSELTIAEGCGNNIKEEFQICNYPLLKKLIVKKNSLKYLNSLVISNNSELESIVTEDGDGYPDYSGAFYYVESVEISSIF